MKIFNLGTGTMVMRLHLMSAVVVTFGFLGMMYIGIIVGMIIFLTTLMGIKWRYIAQIFQPKHKNPQYDWQQHHKPIHH